VGAIGALNIAITADPEIAVPPKLYGGIERIIDLLAHGLARRGHQVTLFAHPESNTAGRLVPWLGRSSASYQDTARNAQVLWQQVRSERFDLVHSFSRIAYMTPILPLRVPKLMTYQREISPRSVRLGHGLSRGTLQFSAISRWMMQPVRRLGRWHLVPNGVALDTYTFRADVPDDAPLAFLGRVEEIKGPHLAIQVAKAANAKLIIAGNVPTEHRAWFEQHVAPHIDGRQIRYLGPVDDRQKNDLLGSARAFLMPILWEEPFGIVMAEAMACGTPVLGLNRGAVPEVVEDGVTGFVADDLAGLVASVGRLKAIDRRACRERVERMFSEAAVVEGYLRVYQKLIDRR